MSTRIVVFNIEGPTADEFIHLEEWYQFAGDGDPIEAMQAAVAEVDTDEEPLEWQDLDVLSDDVLHRHGFRRYVPEVDVLCVVEYGELVSEWSPNGVPEA